MNPLVKKEIRLLLPSWLTVSSLAILLPWVWKTDGTVITVSPAVCFFGTILIAVNSFGREFNLGTFSSLMSQPLERRRIWRNKITLLAVGVASTCIVQLVSYELWFHWWLPMSGSLSYISLGDDWWLWVGATATLMLVAAAGGLWTTLLLRQVAAAMWITFLAPLAGVLLIVFLLSQMFPSIPAPFVESVLFGVAGLYIVAGFLLARWLFFRAQDVGWSGGIISLPEWRVPSARAETAVSSRNRKPILALLKKEFQLQKIGLMGAAALLVLHVGVILLRKYHTFAKDSLGELFTSVFWMLWLMMPLIVGSMAVAEERQLGVMEGQLCLPMSRRLQFAVKWLLTLLLGVFLGGVLPLLLEVIAIGFGSPNPEFLRGVDWIEVVRIELAVAAFAAALALASFFASTLARSFLQALGLAIATVLGGYLIGIGLVKATSVFGIVSLRPSAMTAVLAVPIVIVTLLRLGYWNFTNLHRGWPLWRRNLIGLTGAAAFLIVGSAVIYNRAWEVFQPAEPPHATPVFSWSNPPTLQGDSSGNLLVRWPDGRVWFDGLAWPFLFDDQPSRQKVFPWLQVRLLPRSAGPRQFIGGSNWVSVTARHINLSNPAGGVPGHIVGYLDTIGIQSDGTLWISREAKPVSWTGARMIRVGAETNWQQVVRADPGFLLLKTDGTLWQWGTNRLDWTQWPTYWPSVRVSRPRQVGAASDWKEVFGVWPGDARKTDGSTWAVHVDWRTGENELERKPNLDQVVPRTFSRAADDSMAYVGKDGTLWVGDRYSHERTKRGEGTGTFLQAGQDTNWVAVAVTWNYMVALKADGSLWKWNLSRNLALEVADTPPTRLGIHSDWIGLTSTWSGMVSLATDGSLWFWPAPGYYEGGLLKTPRQPQLLGNIFSDTH